MQVMVRKVKPGDEGLMLRGQKGDMKAFEALYDRYNKRLFHYILRFVRQRTLAEDILQETFLHLLKGGKGYRKSFRFSTYLFTIGRNLCLDSLKSRQRNHLQISQNDEIERTKDPSKGPHKILEETEMAKILQNEIQTLPADQREVLLLSKYSGFSYDEIAQIIDSTPAAAKQKTYRAMLSLKQKLKNYYD
jgi:RNA polymerase sigma-70 factor (ECF subfamily)